ncbi:MAG: HNH endonuclease [Candidatus Cloacimonetes bacterium]|nr:HNH endonuclease [Candidatus Cloacimonadota bacterium]
MKEEIRKIQTLLDDIQRKSEMKHGESFKESFDLFELPEIVESIVDYLQPLLLPYEAGIYWYLFRHSIIKNGNEYIRVSTRGLGNVKQVLTSSSGQSESLSYGAVQKALNGLITKGAIKKVGDTNRDGTLYKLVLPEEIEICQKRIAEVKITEQPFVDPHKELDYYNIIENRLRIFERDNYKCYYCDMQLTRFSATIDHIQPVSQGGDNSYDNLVTSCLQCNSRRGAKPVMKAILDGEKNRE